MTDFKVGQVIRTKHYTVSPSRLGIITDVRSHTTALATIKMTIITPADVDKVMFNSNSILAYDSILLLDYVASVNDLINNYPEVFL